MALDRSNPLPLWAQLESDLKQRLDADEFGACETCGFTISMARAVRVVSM